MTGPDLPLWLQFALPGAAFLIGAGTIGKWLAGVLRDAVRVQHTRLLKDDFASREEVNGLRGCLEAEVKDLRGQLEGCIRLGQLANENAEAARELAERTQQAQENFQERLVNEAFGPIRAMAETQRKQGETLSAATALLQRLTQQVDNMNNR